MARIGGTPSENSRWTSDTQMLCIMSVGVVSTHAGVVTVNTNIQTISQLMTYDAPTEAYEAYQSNFVGLGSSSTTIIGSGFSHSERSLSVIIQGSAFERSDWISETSIMGRATYGTGMSRFLSLTSGMLVGTRSSALTYDDPVVVDMKFTYFFANPVRFN